MGIARLLCIACILLSSSAYANTLFTSEPSLLDRALAHQTAFRHQLLHPKIAETKNLEDFIDEFAEVIEQSRAEWQYLRVFGPREKTFNLSDGLPRLGIRILIEGERSIAFTERYRGSLLGQSEIFRKDLEFLPHNAPLAFAATVIDEGALDAHITKDTRFGTYFILASGKCGQALLEGGYDMDHQFMIYASIAFRF